LNIFVLDLSPQKAAQYHMNSHVCKMILESAQLLSNAVYENNKYLYDMLNEKGLMSKYAWYNHPCSKWAGDSADNFAWLLELALNLCEEYSYRYKKVHSYQPRLWRYASIDLEDITCPMTPFYLAMPDDCKSNDPVESYRKYYMNYKRHLASWKMRGCPEWWK